MNRTDEDRKETQFSTWYSNDTIHQILGTEEGNAAWYVFLNSDEFSFVEEFSALYSLAQTREQSDYIDIYFSNNIFQNDTEKIVSCGPLCAEIGLHFLKLSPQLDFLKEEGITITSGKRIGIKLVDATVLLPKIIREINKANYQETIIELREKHDGIRKNSSVGNKNSLQEAVLAKLQEKSETPTELETFSPKNPGLSKEAATLEIFKPQK